MLDTLDPEKQPRILSHSAPRAALPGSERLLYRALLMVSDAAALLVAFALAYWLRFYVEITVAPGIEPSPAVYFPLILVMIPVWLLIFALVELYDMHILLGGLREYTQVVTACTYGMMLVILASFLVRQFDVSRGWLVMAWLLATFIVCASRMAARRVAYSQRRRGRFLNRALIVGANAEAQALAVQLRESASSGLYVAGFITTDSGREAPTRAGVAGLPLIGSLNSLAQIAAERSIDEIVVATSAVSDVELVSLTQFVTEHPAIELSLSSGLYEVLTTGMHGFTRASVPLVAVNKLRLSRTEAFIKGMLDYGLIVLMLPLLLPVFLVLAAIVKLDSPGPVFYRRRVVGVSGREFDAFKFRTMRADGETMLAAQPHLKQMLAEDHKLKDDPRITRAGRWMRRTSLDELPQLINVLLGQMSLVGPRMIHPSEAPKYGRLKGNLLSVKPGLTGMWQVSGRSDLAYEDRVQLDMVYIRNYSVWLDLQILFVQTLPAVLKGSGAY